MAARGPLGSRHGPDASRARGPCTLFGSWQQNMLARSLGAPDRLWGSDCNYTCWFKTIGGCKAMTRISEVVGSRSCVSSSSHFFSPPLFLFPPLLVLLASSPSKLVDSVSVIFCGAQLCCRMDQWIVIGNRAFRFDDLAADGTLLEAAKAESLFGHNMP